MSERVYIAVYDAGAETDGATVTRQIPLRNVTRDKFKVRRILGANSAATKFQIFRPGTDHTGVFSAPATIGSSLLLPTLEYRATDNINFQLAPVARDVVACGARPFARAYVGFQGTVNVPQTEIVIPADARPYSYRETLSLSWYKYASIITGAVESPRRFSMRIDRGNFALTGLSISKAGTPATSNDFLMRIMDAADNSLSNLPIPQTWINRVGGLSGVIWPPVLYPKGTSLTYEITSLICNLDGAMPKAYDINFEGVIWS